MGRGSGRLDCGNARQLVGIARTLGLELLVLAGELDYLLRLELILELLEVDLLLQLLGLLLLLLMRLAHLLLLLDASALILLLEALQLVAQYLVLHHSPMHIKYIHLTSERRERKRDKQTTNLAGFLHAFGLDLLELAAQILDKSVRIEAPAAAAAATGDVQGCRSCVHVVLLLLLGSGQNNGRVELREDVHGVAGRVMHVVGELELRLDHLRGSYELRVRYVEGVIVVVVGSCCCCG